MSFGLSLFFLRLELEACVIKGRLYRVLANQFTETGGNALRCSGMSLGSGLLGHRLQAAGIGEQAGQGLKQRGL